MTSNPSGGHTERCAESTCRRRETRSHFTNQFLLRAPVWTRIVWQITRNFILHRAHMMPTCRPRDPAFNLQNMQGGDLSGPSTESVFTQGDRWKTYLRRAPRLLSHNFSRSSLVDGTRINSLTDRLFSRQWHLFHMCIRQRAWRSCCKAEAPYK